ncbi:related to SIT4-associating protein SAP190 [Zygosaccharomyces bailii]|nr:related to SIT4-associating protein SAP190 [Zygosaccharomyces bailii]
MSGSFWKFGQDYSAESPITRVLNNAFIRKEEAPGGDASSKEVTKPFHDSGDVEEDLKEEENRDEESTLPTTEAEYVHYRPNLDVLEDLLDDEELYTELMCSNFKLLIYLKYPEVLSKLIDYVTSETATKENPEGQALLDDLHADTEAVIENAAPDQEEADLPELFVEEPEDVVEQKQENQGQTDDEEQSEKENGEDSLSEPSEETSVTLPPESEEQVESRRACMAAEVLSADVWPISSAIMEHQDLLGRLWAILDRISPLSIVTSTYFMKINERLLDMDITGMMEFILTQDNVVDRFLNHVDNPPLMDFLLKVISADKPDSPTGIIEVLKAQDLVPQLLDHLNPEYGPATQSAAGDFLKAFVTISANSNNELASGIGPNELTRQLVSPEMMEKLIKIMLKGGTSLSNGVGIIIELIRKNNSDYDFVQVVYTTLETHPPSDRDPVYLGHLVKLFAKHMPEFNKILLESELSPLKTPFGSIEPLGFERFKICELVAELLHCSNMTLINEPSGESIVHERDVERVRLLNLQRRERQVKGDHSQVESSTPNDQSSVSSNNESSHGDIGDNELENSLAKVEAQTEFGREPQELKALGEENEPEEEKDLGERKDVGEVIDLKKRSGGTEERGAHQEEIIINKFSSLQLSPSGTDSFDTTEDYEANSTVNNDTEIHSEESSDFEVAERTLRENPIVGDQLKIALHDTKIIETILTMFFRFAWNNFLHNVVFDIVQQIFNGPLKTGYNRFLLTDLLVEANITKMIMEGDQKCSDYEKETGLRLGYMGHLTLIAEEVAKFSAYIEEMKVTFSNPAIWDSLNEKNWKEYTETVLADTREKYNTVLGDFADDEEEEVNRDDMISEHDVDEEEDTTGYNTQNYDFNFSRPDSYRGFLESTGNEDEDEAGYNELEDSRYYEYINGDGTKTRLELEPSLDYDVSEDKEKDAANAEDPTSEDNQFTNYMSNQLVRGFTGGDQYDEEEEEELGSDEDKGADKGYGEAENEDAWTTGAFSFNGAPRRSLPSNPEIYTKNVFQHQFELEGLGDEDDDYMDPNDDGQSYAKPNHPLYSNIITPTASHRQTDSFYDKVLIHGNDDDISDDSDAELEEEISAEEEQNAEESPEDPNDDGYSLCRSTSKDNLSWDKNEQDRLMEMVNYNRKQNTSK